MDAQGMARVSFVSQCTRTFCLIHDSESKSLVLTGSRLHRSALYARDRRRRLWWFARWERAPQGLTLGRMACRAVGKRLWHRMARVGRDVDVDGGVGVGAGVGGDVVVVVDVVAGRGAEEEGMARSGEVAEGSSLEDGVGRNDASCRGGSDAVGDSRAELALSPVLEAAGGTLSSSGGGLALTAEVDHTQSDGVRIQLNALGESGHAMTLV